MLVKLMDINKLRQRAFVV